MTISITFAQQNGSEQALQTDNLNQSLMELARENAVPGIAADCGGACACATCHVHIDPAWMDIVGQPSSVEADMLDLSADPTETSRLSCQIELKPELDGLRVTVITN